MKSASFPRLVLFAMLAGAMALTLTGCGFVNDSSSGSALKAGNWSLVATSTVTSNQISYIGGNLSVSGTSVSSTLHSGLPCFDVSQPVAFTGTIQNKQLTLTSTANTNNQVVTVIAAASSASAFAGSYTVNAGGGCPADQGTVSAALVPSLNGTWQGKISNDFFGDPNATLSMALTQATTASSDGTFALTGNLTYANSSCSKSGTVGNSYVAGSTLVINGSTLEQDGVTTGSFTYTDAHLNNPATPTSMLNGTYQVIDGFCGGDADTPTFTKQ